jgi:hypothetical protein
LPSKGETPISPFEGNGVQLSQEAPNLLSLDWSASGTLAAWQHKHWVYRDNCQQTLLLQLPTTFQTASHLKGSNTFQGLKIQFYFTDNDLPHSIDKNCLFIDKFSNAFFLCTFLQVVCTFHSGFLFKQLIIIIQFDSFASHFD